MISLNTIAIILFTHWLADFVFQSDEVAKNKSKNIYVLMLHIGIYNLVSVIVYGIMFTSIPFSLISAFTISNSLLHFLTDYITAPIVSSCFANQDHHNAFVVIGFDQLVHILCLIGTSTLFLI